MVPATWRGVWFLFSFKAEAVFSVIKLMAAPVSRIARAQTELPSFIKVTVAVRRNRDSEWTGSVVAAVRDGTAAGVGGVASRGVATGVLSRWSRV